MSNDPTRDCLQAAWAALMRGDTAERDRQCLKAKRIMDAQNKPPPIKLIRQADGSYVPEIVTQ